MILSQDGQVDLYSMTLSDRKLTRLTSNIGNEASPVYSPDGSKLLFVSDSASRSPTSPMPASADGVTSAKSTNAVPPAAGAAAQPALSPRRWNACATTCPCASVTSTASVGRASAARAAKPPSLACLHADLAGLDQYRHDVVGSSARR